MKRSVPAVLLERLGEPASAALIQLLDEDTRLCTEFVMTQSAERFERRLVEETSKLRVEMAGMKGELRQETALLGSSLRAEMAAGRVELLKWMFVFWAGQVVAISGIMALLLRTMLPR